MSMVQELVSNIRSRYADRRKAKETTFIQLVRDIAAGESVDPDSTIAILEASGRTADELQQAVETIQKRLKWRQQIIDRELALKQSAAAQAEIAKLGNELEAFRLKLLPAHNAAVESMRVADAKVLGGQMAEQYLRQSVIDPELLAREKKLQSSVVELLARKTELVGRLDLSGLEDCRRRVEHAKSELKKYSDPSNVRESALADAEKVDGEYEIRSQAVAEFRQQVSDIDAQLADIEREREAIESQKLVP